MNEPAKEVQNPIRIAHIIGKMWAGGVETVAFNYYRAIDHSKYQFDFFYDSDSTVDPPQDIVALGARFYKLPPYQKLPSYIKTLTSFLRKGKYRIVHSHLNTISVFPLYCAWKENVPIRIAHNHSVPGGDEIKRNIAKNILRCFSKIFSTDYFACSEKAGRWLFGNKDFDEGNINVLKNAVDFDRFIIPSSDIENLRKKLGINSSLVVGHVGRFTYAKNHQFLLDIFKEILKLKGDAILLLVGDGELHKSIKDGIVKRGLQNNVILTGKVNNPEIYYKLNNIIILPSIYEGLSMTTIESQVAGVPIIISKAIPKEAIISNGCKYMDINISATRWAKMAIELADKKVLLTKKSEEYNIRIQVKKLEDYYHKALGDINV